MKKKSVGIAAIAAVSALALGACGAAPDDTPATTGGGEATGGAKDYIACMVSDQGGFDDKSFNQSGFEGLTQAQTELGVTIKKAESKAPADFVPNVDAMVSENCNLIIGVGFMLADAIRDSAKANTDINYALVDSAFSEPDPDDSTKTVPLTLDNARPLVFNTAEAAYLAGYVAAAVSKSGIVATFGGMQIPSVSIFMDGFADGVKKYNEDNGKTVTVLGWDKDAQTGSFTGDFEDQTKGQNLAQSFITQGADVIMPVAGPVGIGAAAAAQEAGNVYIVGVDADWYETNPQYKGIILTSVVKEIGASVFDTVKSGSEGSFSADPYIGTLENGGVSIAPFHDLDAQVPADVKTKVDELKQQIISGDIKVETPNAPQ